MFYCRFLPEPLFDPRFSPRNSPLTASRNKPFFTFCLSITANGKPPLASYGSATSLRYNAHNCKEKLCSP